MNERIKRIILILSFTFLFVFSESIHFYYQQIIALCFVAVLLLLDYFKKLYILVPLLFILCAVPLIFEQIRQIFMIVYLPVIWLLLANKINTEYKDQYYPMLVSMVAVVLSLIVNIYYITKITWSIFSYKTVLNRITLMLVLFIVFAVFQWVQHKKTKTDKSYNFWPLFIIYLLTLLLQLPVSDNYYEYQIGIYLLLPSVVFITVCFQPSPKLKKYFA